MKGDYATGIGKRSAYCFPCQGDIWFSSDRIKRGEWVSKLTGNKQIAPYVDCPVCGGRVRIEAVPLVA